LEENVKEKECEYCHNFFVPDKEQRKYCSKDCQQKKRHNDSFIEVSCQFCGNKYITKKIEHNRWLNKKKKHECCSSICSNRLTSMNNRGAKNSRYNKVEKICEICGIKYSTKNNQSKNSKYCSRKCLAESKKIKGRTELRCEHCNSYFYVKKGDLKALGKIKYCSKKCRIMASQRRVYFKCLICGKEYWQHLAYSKTSVTCSVKCQKRWQSEIYTKDTLVKKRLKKQGAESQRNQKKKRTLPEMIVETFLLENNIAFIQQFTIADSFSADFYLPDFNCVLEVYGDYWHSNPSIYGKNKKKLNETQIKIKERDRRRYRIITKEYHYYFYKIWECDIKKDINKSMKKFLEYINLKIRNESVV